MTERPQYFVGIALDTVSDHNGVQPDSPQSIGRRIRRQRKHIDLPRHPPARGPPALAPPDRRLHCPRPPTCRRYISLPGLRPKLIPRQYADRQHRRRLSYAHTVHDLKQRLDWTSRSLICKESLSRFTNRYA